MANLKGIDVSHHQGIINWQKVKSAGVEFAIIKAGGSDDGFYTDAAFERNYAGAKAACIAVGAYYYVGMNCTSREDGIADAKRFVKIIEGKQFEYPVYIDLEATSPDDKTGATEACIGFCEYMESQGYYCGIYSSDISGFVDRLDLRRLEQFDKWVARYGSQPKMVSAYGIWQYSDTGHVPGISRNVDLDESYIDYAKIMQDKGLNGFEKPAPTPKPNTTEKLPHIPGLTAADVSIYFRWCAEVGLGKYPDTEEGFKKFLGV